MSTDSDQLLADRFAGLAPKADVDGWADVLRRARRPGTPRALLVAALLAGALAVAGGALALSGAGTGEPAIDRLLERAGRDFDDVPVGAPKPRFQPQPGSVSEPVRFRFERLRFTAVGYRAADGMICSATVDPAAVRTTGGIGCVGTRHLDRSLRREPVLLSGGGGGRVRVAHGFTRADVESLRLVGTGERAAVALSSPWRPRGPESEPIRFFYVVVKSDALGPRAVLLPKGARIEARLADGSVSVLQR